MQDQLADFIIDAPSHFAVPSVRMPLSNSIRFRAEGRKALFPEPRISPSSCNAPKEFDCANNLAGDDVYAIIIVMSRGGVVSAEAAGRTKSRG
jgi:hypothetical protein